MFNIFKQKPAREARITRITKETEIVCSLKIDGKGEAKIQTGIGLLNHMLELFAFHGLFDLDLKAKGDLKIDLHHTNEDIGIVLGQAFKKALGKMMGINRFGSFSAPMEDVLADVRLDIGGRGYFSGIRLKNFFVKQPATYAMEDANHFFEAFAKQGGINLIIEITGSEMNPVVDIHTGLESVFKAFGKALDQATQIDPRRSGVPSTKGIID